MKSDLLSEFIQKKDKKIKKLDLSISNDFKFDWFEQCADGCQICHSITQDLDSEKSELIGQIFEKYFGYKRTFRTNVA